MGNERTSVPVCSGDMNVQQPVIPRRPPRSPPALSLSESPLFLLFPPVTLNQKQPELLPPSTDEVTSTVSLSVTGPVRLLTHLAKFYARRKKQVEEENP